MSNAQENLIKTFAKYPVSFDPLVMIADNDPINMKNAKEIFTSRNRNELSEFHTGFYLGVFAESERALKYILPKAMITFPPDHIDFCLILDRLTKFKFTNWPPEEQQAVLNFLRVQIANIKEPIRLGATRRMSETRLNEVFQALPEIALLLADKTFTTRK